MLSRKTWSNIGKLQKEVLASEQMEAKIGNNILRGQRTEAWKVVSLIHKLDN